jgi:peptidoglycan/xylan/chitin deacetylase (PgdA/CDA1 family)
MTVADVLAMQRSGHEIGSHTRSHPNLVDDIKDDDGLKAEIGGSQADLMRVGIATVDTFAYPYGQHDQRVRRIVADHFIAARTTEAGFNTTVEDRFALKSQSVVTTTTPAELRAWTDYAIANRVWLILTLHRVEPDLADCVRFGTEEADPECTDVATLQSIVDYLKGLPEGTVRTVREIVSDDALWATPPSDPPR